MDNNVPVLASTHLSGELTQPWFAGSGKKFPAVFAVQPFSRDAYFARAFATFGATTNWQYG
jgi:hypothetical protein